MVDINDIFMKNNVLPRSTVANPNFINQPQTRTSPYSVLTTPKSRFTALPAKEGSYTLGQTAQNQVANGMQQGGKNMYAKPAFVKPTQTLPTNVPPNQLGQNLLNFTTSPQGRGLARGLLEASGYSTTPVSMGSALAQGMKYIDEADAAQSAAKQKEFENQLAIDSLIVKSLNNQPDQYRALTSEERSAFGIPAEGAFRFNITKGKPESIGGGGSTTNTTLINQAATEGTKNYFETKGGAFAKNANKIEATAISADEDNQLLNRFEQLAQNVNTGALAPFLQSLQGFSQALGISDDLTGLGALEALNSVSGRFVMQQVQKTKGAVSDREMAYFFKISANIGNSGLGNQLIINMARSINDRAIAENNLLQNFLEEQYKINPNQENYELEQKFKKVKEQFRKENQLFTGDIEEEIKQYYKDNGLTYTGGVSDITKTDINRTNNLSKFQEKYPNAKYMGETENGKSQFQVDVDGDLQTFEI